MDDNYGLTFTTCPDCGGVVEKGRGHIDTTTNDTIGCPSRPCCNLGTGHRGHCMWT